MDNYIKFSELNIGVEVDFQGWRMYKLGRQGLVAMGKARDIVDPEYKELPRLIIDKLPVFIQEA